MVFPPSYTACQNCVFKFRIIPLPYSNKVCLFHIILKKMLLFPFLGRRNTCYNALRIWVFLFATIHVRVSTQQRTHIVLYFYECIYIILYYTVYMHVKYSSGWERGEAFRLNTILSRVPLWNKNLQYILCVPFEDRAKWPAHKSDSMTFSQRYIWR